jgi:hypothetical protein
VLSREAAELPDNCCSRLGVWRGEEWGTAAKEHFAPLYFGPGGYIDEVHDEALKKDKTEFMDAAISLRSKLVMLVPGVSGSNKLSDYQSVAD